MAMNQDLPATDSAAALHELIGEDSTATFENDPTFSESNPTAAASSENLQSRADRQETQNQPSLKTRDTDDVADEEEDDDEDEDDDEEFEDVDEDEEGDDDLDEDDEDEDLEDDDEDDEEEDEE